MGRQNIGRTAQGINYQQRHSYLSGREVISRSESHAVACDHFQNLEQKVNGCHEFSSGEVCLVMVVVQTYLVAPAPVDDERCDNLEQILENLRLVVLQSCRMRQA